MNDGPPRTGSGFTISRSVIVYNNPNATNSRSVALISEVTPTNSGISFNISSTDPDYLTGPLDGHYRFIDLLHGHFQIQESFQYLRDRNKFVQRVYLLLATQFFFNFICLTATNYVPVLKRYFKKNKTPMVIFFIIVYAALVSALAYNVNLRRKTPLNFVLLTVMTFCMSFLLCTLSVAVDTVAVLYITILLAMVLFSATLFAVQEKWDVTSYVMYIYVTCSVGLTSGLLIMTAYLSSKNIKILPLICASLGTHLFLMWLLFDTKRIIKKEGLEMSPSEYGLGVLTLNVDMIIYIFIPIMPIYELYLLLVVHSKRFFSCCR